MTIREIYLDLDDVLNTLSPYALHAVGCPIRPTDYEHYPLECDFNIAGSANQLLGEPRYTPETFWAAVPLWVWSSAPETPFCQWLIEGAASLVGCENVCIATSTIDDPQTLACKLTWIQTHLPRWLHRSYDMTPCKWRLARPGALLIDDNEDNVQRWCQRGGTAVLLPRPWNTRRGQDPAEVLFREKLLSPLYFSRQTRI